MRRAVAALSREPRAELVADVFLILGLLFVGVGFALVALWLGLVVVGALLLAHVWVPHVLAILARRGER